MHGAPLGLEEGPSDGANDELMDGNDNIGVK